MNDVPSTSPAPQATLGAIDASCRLPLFLMFVSAAVWLVIGSAFAMAATLTFHKPTLFADCAWLSYGRAWPASLNSVLFGFCVQAGLGVTLWLMARLGRMPLPRPWIVAIGAILWNLGATIGIIEILAGDSTGFQYLEMPRYAALILFLGYALIGLWTLLNFHQRRVRGLFVSQWFLVAALFWFPWIYSTAYMLLAGFPVRGVAQAVIAWWFSNNLLVVWLNLVGLAVIFYFVPKFTSGELYSRYLALLTFWLVILIGTWGGIPSSAPVPAWMPALSTVGTILLVLPLLTVALNVFGTLLKQSDKVKSQLPLQFIWLGFIGFLTAMLMHIVAALPPVSPITNFTWFTSARLYATVYGYFSLVIFGAVYFIVPQLAGFEFSSQRVRAHLWAATAGIILNVLPLAIGGLAQGLRFQNSLISTIDVSVGTLPFLRVSTLGDLLILAGHVIFFINVAGVVSRFSRTRASAAYEVATADLFKTAEAKP